MIHTVSVQWLHSDHNSGACLQKVTPPNTFIHASEPNDCVSKLYYATKITSAMKYKRQFTLEMFIVHQFCFVDTDIQAFKIPLSVVIVYWEKNTEIGYKYVYVCSHFCVL